MSNKRKRIFVFLFIFFSFLCCFRDINAQVKINEFLPDSSIEWIEFYNSSDSADFLRSYYVDDDTDFNSDSGSTTKKILSNLDTSNITFPFVELNSFLNNGGDWVVIFDSLGNLIDSFQYNSNPGTNISMGRSPDESGDFFILSLLTKGGSNALPVATSTPSATEESEETETNTPTPTSTFTAAPTSTPVKTITPTSKPTKAPTPISEKNTDEGVVMGIKEDNIISIPDGEFNEETKKPKVSILAIIFVFIGICFVGFSGFAFFRQKRLNNNVNEKGNTII